jgi:hypothetical protein
MDLLYSSLVSFSLDSLGSGKDSVFPLPLVVGWTQLVLVQVPASIAEIYLIFIPIIAPTCNTTHAPSLPSRIVFLRSYRPLLPTHTHTLIRAQALPLPSSLMSPLQQVLVPWEWGYQRHRQRSGSPLSGLEAAFSAGCGHSVGWRCLRPRARSCRLVLGLRRGMPLGKYRVEVSRGFSRAVCRRRVWVWLGRVRRSRRGREGIRVRVRGCRRRLVLRNVDELVSNKRSFFVFLCTDWLSYSSPCLWKAAPLSDFVFRDSWYLTRSLWRLRSSTLPNNLCLPPSHLTFKPTPWAPLPRFPSCRTPHLLLDILPLSHNGQRTSRTSFCMTHRTVYFHSAGICWS